LAEGPRKFKLLGYTVDDAPGELFDKVARHLGLGYPGGPVIQKTGEQGDPYRYKLPRPMADKGYLFSFSGLKTAVMRLVAKERQNLVLEDLCAALQLAVADTFSKKTAKALKETKAPRLVMAGGVAANQPLRQAMKKVAEKHQAELLMPSIHLCTDNAAMIAAHGFITANEAPQNASLINAAANWDMGSDYIF
jgi:N6-L-threonylcarbamoyladenine synthase